MKKEIEERKTPLPYDERKPHHLSNQVEELEKMYDDYEGEDRIMQINILKSNDEALYKSVFIISDKNNSQLTAEDIEKSLKESRIIFKHAGETDEQKVSSERGSNEIATTNNDFTTALADPDKFHYYFNATLLERDNYVEELISSSNDFYRKQLFRGIQEIDKELILLLKLAILTQVVNKVEKSYKPLETIEDVIEYSKAVEETFAGYDYEKERFTFTHLNNEGKVDCLVAQPKQLKTQQNIIEEENRDFEIVNRQLEHSHKVVKKQNRVISKQRTVIQKLGNVSRNKIPDQTLEEVVEVTRKKNGKINYSAGAKLMGIHRDTLKSMILRRNLTYLLQK